MTRINSNAKSQISAPPIDLYRKRIGFYTLLQYFTQYIFNINYNTLCHLLFHYYY